MFNPIVFDSNICDGCNVCVELCLMDILEANAVKGNPPLVRYPDECAYDGVCFERCPKSGLGAIQVIPPLPMRVSILRGQGVPGSSQSA